MSTLKQYQEAYKPGDSLQKLESMGFTITQSNGGGKEGWKETDGQITFVDHWGGVWAKAEVGCRKWNGAQWVVWNGSTWKPEELSQ